MDAGLNVFLRDNTHNDASWRLLLKADQFTQSFARTPIHIAIPYSEPEIFDLGATRPSITVSGVMDTITILTTDTGSDLQLEVGNALYAKALSSSNQSTGGGIYSVGVQQFQFTLAPGMEDRYQFTIQFVAKFRTGSTYRAGATTDKIAFP